MRRGVRRGWPVCGGTAHDIDRRMERSFIAFTGSLAPGFSLYPIPTGPGESAEVAMGMYVAGVIVLVVVAWAALTYNRLVRMRNMVREGWSGIDVQLKRRATLIPALVETVKGYMGHERGLLSEVAELRSRSLLAERIGEKGAIETALSRSLGNLLAVAEAYPDLKASHNFGELHKELTGIEDQIQMARRYYNGTVRNLNIAVESFPSNIVAGLFTFTQAEFFAIDDEADRKAPQVHLAGQG